jgi:aminopeptidase-like protein
MLEENRTYRNTNPKCEPQLGKRGLYRSVGGTDGKMSELALLWILNQADGTQTLLDIAEKARLPWDVLSSAAESLKAVGLLELVHS